MSGQEHKTKCTLTNVEPETFPFPDFSNKTCFILVYSFFQTAEQIDMKFSRTLTVDKDLYRYATKTLKGFAGFVQSGRI